MNWSMPIMLASRSPRRLQLLQAAGWPVRLVPSDLDDGRLQMGSVKPEAWVEALACLKARASAHAMQTRGASDDPCTILGADTVCVHDGTVLGQPADAAAAKSMLMRHCNTSHEVLTGTCLIAWPSQERHLFVDQATVTWGDIELSALDQYIDSQQWRGKAGGYNLQERIDAGWPIACTGDPATVMGLPMRRLHELFEGSGSGTVSA